jgi:hypothetical protein
MFEPPEKGEWATLHLNLSTRPYKPREWPYEAGYIASLSRRVEVSNREFSGEGATAFLNLVCQETSNGGLPLIERRPP